jgi:hypothetical protein
MRKHIIVVRPYFLNKSVVERRIVVVGSHRCARHLDKDLLSRLVPWTPGFRSLLALYFNQPTKQLND